MGPLNFTLAAITATLALAVPSIASASTMRLSVSGYGSATWGTSTPNVEADLGVELSCSGGGIPGMCACPTAHPALPAVLVFGPAGTMSAAFTANRSAYTSRGIHVGSSEAAVRSAYPSARLHVRQGLTSGLSTFLLYRSAGHALAFVLTGSRVSGIDAFANGRGISAELCG